MKNQKSMKIKVNKYQVLDNYEKTYQRYMCNSGFRATGGTPHEFEEMDVTEEELLDFIKKGYGIKINC